MFGLCFFFFFKQKTAYEMRISDWSSDVCSSDLLAGPLQRLQALDRSGHFHAVVGGKRRAAGEFKLPIALAQERAPAAGRSEAHTSELQSLMRISYAGFCLKQKNHRAESIAPRL